MLNQILDDCGDGGAHAKDVKAEKPTGDSANEICAGTSLLVGDPRLMEVLQNFHLIVDFDFDFFQVSLLRCSSSPNDNGRFYQTTKSQHPIGRT